jgi:predicted RNA-binding protein YlxR (DUF448 family)
MDRRAGPVRTCVGCRERAPAAELLRVVAVDSSVVPDPARKLPGRGASVHRDLACLALAERRRAFGRALRVDGALDTGPLRRYLAELGDTDRAGRAPAHGMGSRSDR